MNVLIFDAVRTPRGKARPDGGLAQETPHGLVAHLAAAIGARGNDPRAVDQLTLGCVGQIGAQGGHIGMVAKLACGLPDRVAPHSLNNYCASGLSAIGQAAAAVAAGQIDRALAGGVEMMSRVPFMADKADYYEATDFAPRRRYIPVAVAADLLAVKERIDREALDRVAATSQARAAAAEDTPALIASRIAIGGLDREEAPRATTPEALAKMPPAFAAMAAGYVEALGGATIEHRHTVAHAPPMTDGAGLALIGRNGEGARARILAYAEAGGDPRDSLTAGFTAMNRALARAELGLRDLDRIEFMEAFAVTIAKFMRDCPVDPDRVNVSGGHLAKGHPMGATGAILLSTLLDALDAADGTLGMVVVTGANGVGAAMIVERLR
ncbi:thiolase family protein [Glacieibacterium frigidum]|uniref:Acyl-CoA thiolase n=1 Tax=Glacieibacterium frigidum TaxID=2593303 RepID=A0A552U766_9SPHN|nr:beta-ketoacyl synthase N-terminal-like domain-containing protein [Glacieibacterium frigidum]TRW14065.1 acyl-CoA thiolase [Glacieibacterium frigidum]